MTHPLIGGNDERWKFNITLTRDEVDAQFLAIPKHIACNRAFFKAHLSEEEERNLNNDKTVHVILRSVDRMEFYDMSVKRAPWNPDALMLAPWKDRIDGNVVSGTKFFQDFNVRKSSKLEFCWKDGILFFKVLKQG